MGQTVDISLMYVNVPRDRNQSELVLTGQLRASCSSYEVMLGEFYFSAESSSFGGLLEDTAKAKVHSVHPASLPMGIGY